MPRPPRSMMGNTVYHVLNRANGRMQIKIFLLRRKRNFLCGYSPTASCPTIGILFCTQRSVVTSQLLCGGLPSRIPNDGLFIARWLAMDIFTKEDINPFPSKRMNIFRPSVVTWREMLCVQNSLLELRIGDGPVHGFENMAQMNRANYFLLGQYRWRMTIPKDLMKYMRTRNLQTVRELDFRQFLDVVKPQN